LPAVITQSPEQHVSLLLHTSPVWMQNEEPSLQTPASHSCEQQSALAAQGLPAVRQLAPGFRGWHMPPAQLPPQHEGESVHACPSAMQLPALQRLPEQMSEQHSVEAAQPPPVAVHTLIEAAQVRVAGSQRVEQQSAPFAHGWLNARQ
jgi:hypothetical protein